MFSARRQETKERAERRIADAREMDLRMFKGGSFRIIRLGGIWVILSNDISYIIPAAEGFVKGNARSDGKKTEKMRQKERRGVPLPQFALVSQ